MKRLSFCKPLAISILLWSVVACSGSTNDGGTISAENGSGGGVGGSGVTSGTITGFGSVFVNGVEFETAGTLVEVDEQAATESDLRIGMVVIVVGTTAADGVTGNADTIVFDENIEGPVTDLDNNPGGDTKEFKVLGITIVIEKSSTVFDRTDFPGFNFNSFKDTDIVEISGLFDENDKLRASYINKTGSLKPNGRNRTEIAGTIGSIVDADTFVLNTTGMSTLTVDYDAGTDLSDLPGGIIDTGLDVQLTGNLLDASTVLAEKIELQTSPFQGNGVVNIEGIVTDFNGIGSFSVAGQTVDASSANFKPDTLQISLLDGVLVQVKGQINNGVIDANIVEGGN